MAKIFSVVPGPCLLALGTVAILGGCASGKNDHGVPSISVSEPGYENRFTGSDDQETYTAIVPATNYQTELQPDRPDSYTVVRGDTLWDISGRFLTKPWLWPQLWEINPDIDNPHLIYPGDVISLAYRDGQPRFVHSRNGQELNGRSEAASIAAKRDLPDGTKYQRLSPEVRVEALEDAIPTIPGDAISQFLVHPRVVTQAQLDSAPYIVGNNDDRLTSAVGHEIYVRGQLDPNQSSYGIFRKSNELRDPVTNELLGHEVTHVATAKLVALGDPSTLKIVDNKMETLNGDLLMLGSDTEAVHNYVPRVPQMQGEGRIISLFNAIAQSGRNQVVVVNIGSEAGIQVGDVMAIERSGGTLTDRRQKRGQNIINLPSTRTGVLMVFRTFDKVSYALVMESSRPIHINDIVTDI